MYKKTTKILSLALIAILCISLFAGCSSGSMAENGMVADKYYPMEDSVAGDFDGILNESVSNGTSGSGSPSESEQPTTQQKIIQTYDFSVETLKFDEAIAELEKKVSELGGYIEKSSSYGNESKYYNNRNASYVLRIPVESSKQFTEYVTTNLIVLEKQVGTKDVTSQYIDIESRLSALRTEKAVLEDLLAKATSMNDVLAIQRQLTDVIYEIESYESKIRTYDNLIAYTTVNIQINEVKEPTVVKELTVWEKIAEGFDENFDDVIDDFTNLFIWFIASLPKLTVFVVFNGIVFLIVRAIVKASKKKKAAKKDKVAEKKETISENNVPNPNHDPNKPFEG